MEKHIGNYDFNWQCLTAPGFFPFKKSSKFLSLKRYIKAMLSFKLQRQLQQGKPGVITSMTVCNKIVSHKVFFFFLKYCYILLVNHLLMIYNMLKRGFCMYINLGIFLVMRGGLLYGCRFNIDFGTFDDKFFGLFHVFVLKLAYGCQILFTRF